MTDVHPRTSSGIAAFTWGAWPFLAWGLPVFLVLRGFIGDMGGWESLFLLLASPLLVPALGLLGMLPRFLLRRRGHRVTPEPLVGLLVLHWWSWVGFIVTLPGTGDSGALDSMLRAVLPMPLSDGIEQAIFFGALFLAGATWVAILVAVTASPSSAEAAPAARGWMLFGWGAVIAGPLLLIGAVLLGSLATSAQRDAAGDSVVTVQSEPVALQTDRAETRYDEAMAMLSPLREAISPSGWAVYSAGLTFYDPDCERQNAQCYGFEVILTSEVVQPAATPEALTELLRADGWAVTEEPSEVVAAKAGYEVNLTVSEKGGARLELNTPRWWGDVLELGPELDARANPSATTQELYAADEWPPLR